jgi:phosphatidylserine/phosphatidylglycerophosphate/cardiolipin synthase-like enzyme
MVRPFGESPLKSDGEIMMKRVFWLTLLLLCGRSYAQMADYPVISELRYYETSGVNEEFVEVYNPLNYTVDMSGWTLQYKSSTGTSWAVKVTFEEGRQIGANSFLLYGGVGMEVTPDYPSNVNPGLGNSGGHIRLVDDGSTVIDQIGWNAGDSPEGESAGTHERGASFERKAMETSTQVDMAEGGVHFLEGNAWDSQNNANDFVAHPTQAASNPQNASSSPEPDEPLTNGSGTATCSITQAYAPGPVDFTLEITAGEHLLESLRVDAPEGWAFSAIDVSGDGATNWMFEGDQDYVFVYGLDIEGENTCILDFHDVTTSMVSGPAIVTISTAVVDGELATIQSSPVIQVVGDPIPMSELHENDGNGVPLLMGDTVVLRGVVTATEVFGAAIYVQDETGGIVAYDGAFADAVNLGDDVSFVGTVVHYNGLCELTPTTLLEVFDTGVNVDPLELTCADIANQGAGGEPYEALLVRLNDLTVEGSGNWAGNTNYNITDGVNTTTMRVTAGCELIGSPIPGGSFDLIGVVGQYDYSVPHFSGYQVLPRYASDLIMTSGPGLAAGPFESGHSTSGVDITWETQLPSSSIIVYGTADGAILDSLEMEDFTTDHSYSLTGLDQATPYWLRVGGRNEVGSNMSGTYWVSTISEIPGTIEVFFTKTVETEYALDGNDANGSYDVKQEVLDLIDGAQYTLDCALYSLNIYDVADAIIDAHDRGVVVRFIYDSDHSQSAVAQIEGAGVTVIDNSYGGYTPAGIQHNKVFIVDVDHADLAKVWTGSLNLIDQPTGYGITAKQNSVLFTDQAVARAFTLEFVEMWGSTGAEPNNIYSRFGERKTNNTPKIFFVGGVPVDVMFSPGDNVSQRIVNYLGDAQESVYFCILSFTRNEIGYAMQDAHNAGAAVRGVFNEEGNEYSEWSTMLGWGADIHTDLGSGILHHKYMVLDSENPDIDPVVLTGSYNWSNSAEYENDENVVAIHNHSIANLYLQEFAARYHESGGTADFTDLEDPAVLPRNAELSSAWPNPFNPTTQMSFLLPQAAEVSLKVFDLLGRDVATLASGTFAAGNHTAQFHGGELASGVYLAALVVDGEQVSVNKMLLVK